MQGYLTSHQVAERLLVTTATVRNWARQGLLGAVTTAGGHRRFAEADVSRFEAQRCNRQSESGQKGGVLVSLDSGIKPRVLIVGNNAENCQELQEQLLQFPGAVGDVLGVSDAFSAGLAIANFQPGVIILDMHTPGLDGIEMKRKLQQNPATRDIRVVMTSRYLTPEIARHLQENGVESWMCSMQDPEEFLGVVSVSGLTTRN